MTDFSKWLHHRKAQMDAAENEWCEQFRTMTIEELSKVEQRWKTRRYRMRCWLRRVFRRSLRVPTPDRPWTGVM